MEKSKSNVGLIIIIILLILLIATMGIYILNKESIINNKKEVTPQMGTAEQKNKITQPIPTENIETPANNESTYHPLSLDKKNQIHKDNKVNNTNYDYHFRDCNGVWIGNGILMREVENNNVFLSISGGIFDFSDSPCNGIDVNIHTSKKIQEVFYGQIGQGIAGGGTTMLFLLEDGTVEYLYMYEAIEAEDFTVKKVPEVNNIVKFYQADVTDENEGWATILAQRNDGKFYDLGDYLPN